MNHKHLIWLALIIAASLIIRVATINYEWIDVDEGNYLYDAKLLSEGETPFKDFYMKEALYTSALALFGKFFGFSLINARFLSVIFSLITIIFMYKIGSMLYGGKTGIIAAAIYAFMPFTIFWNNLVRESVLGIMLMIIAVYYIIKFTKTENFLDISMHTFFLFMAFITRRSMIFFIFAEALLLLYMYRNRIRFLIKSFASAAFGASLPLLLLLAYSYAIDASFTKMLGFEFLPIMQAFSWQQFLGQRILLPYWFLREAAYIALPLLVVPLLRLNEKKRMALLLLSFALVLASAFAFEYAILKFPERMSQYPIPSTSFFSLSLLYIAAFFISSYYILKSNLYAESTNKFIAAWLFSILAFYAVYSRFHVVYLAELMPAATILATPFLITLYHEKTRLSRIFIALLVAGMLMSTYFYVEYHGLNNKWNIETADKISDYLKENTGKAEEIFTPLTFIAVMADRKLALNITHPLIYQFKGIGDKNMAGAPSFRAIIDHLERNKVNYIVADEYMEVTYYSRKQDLKDYIEENYELEKKIDEVSILARKR